MTYSEWYSFVRQPSSSELSQFGIIQLLVHLPRFGPAAEVGFVQNIKVGYMR